MDFVGPINNYNYDLDKNIESDEIMSAINKPDSNTECKAKKIDSSDVILYPYASVTSCDTEPSFSRYKHILSDWRRSFSFDTIKMYLVIHCNEF